MPYKDKVKQAACYKAYRARNKAKMIGRWKAYNATHKAEMAARGKVYHQAHKAEIAARKKAYYAPRKAKFAAYRKAYQHAHPDKSGDRCARRRALKHGATLEKVSRAEVYERDAGRCHICGKKPANLPLPSTTGRSGTSS